MSVKNLYELACQALIQKGTFTDAFYYKDRASVIGAFRISTYYARCQPGWRPDGSVREQMSAFLTSRRCLLSIDYNDGRGNLLLVHPKDLKRVGSVTDTQFYSLLRKLSPNSKPHIPVAFSSNPPVLIGDTDPKVVALCASLRQLTSQ